jgi:hypothetical protein
VISRLCRDRNSETAFETGYFAAFTDAAAFGKTVDIETCEALRVPISKTTFLFRFEVRAMKVFWSWQSDRPGKTGRHFVRSALEAAIAQLKQAEDIAEPSEREAASSMHLDHDRKGVPGSPDLVRTIFDKIERCAIFVADVTPVATVRRDDPETGKRRQKKIMNPNVAIELGFALRALTDARVLMVLNTVYGNRNDLPFDLAHKAGPLTYKLEEDADAATIALEKTKLAAVFREALKLHLQTSTEGARPEFREVPANSVTGLFFEPQEPLASVGEIEDGDFAEQSFGGSRHFFLRAIPTRPLARPLKKTDLLQFAQQKPLDVFSRDHGGIFRANRYGAVAIDLGSSGSALRACSQIFPNGEIWGVNASLFVEREEGAIIPTGALETTLKKCIPAYAKFLFEALQILPPYVFEFGGRELAQTSVVVKGYGGSEFWPLHDPSFSVRVTIADLTAAAFDAARDAFLDELFEGTGFKRPKG